MRTLGFLLTSALVASGCSNDGVTTAGGAEPQAATTPAGLESGSVRLQEESPGLLAQATISDAAARALALQRVPGGEIIDAELEEEHGALLYSYDVRAADGRRRYGVEVDAKTGVVVSVEDDGDSDTEGPADRDDNAASG